MEEIMTNDTGMVSSTESNGPEGKHLLPVACSKATASNYSNHISTKGQIRLKQSIPPNKTHKMDLNPLSPSSSEPISSSNVLEKDRKNSQLPSQMATDTIHISTILSPKPSEYSTKKDESDIKRHDNKTEKYDQKMNTSKVNSHSELNMYNCKHCNFVTTSRTDFWIHARVHIRDRILEFSVTEPKYHFEHHMRTHDGSNLCKCPQCAHRCAQKPARSTSLKPERIATFPFNPLKLNTTPKTKSIFPLFHPYSAHQLHPRKLQNLKPARNIRKAALEEFEKYKKLVSGL